MFSQVICVFGITASFVILYWLKFSFPNEVEHQLLGTFEFHHFLVAGGDIFFLSQSFFILFRYFLSFSSLICNVELGFAKQTFRCP